MQHFKIYWIILKTFPEFCSPSLSLSSKLLHFSSFFDHCCRIIFKQTEISLDYSSSSSFWGVGPYAEEGRREKSQMARKQLQANLPLIVSRYQRHRQPEIRRRPSQRPGKKHHPLDMCNALHKRRLGRRRYARRMKFRRIVCWMFPDLTKNPWLPEVQRILWTYLIQTFYKKSAIFGWDFLKENREIYISYYLVSRCKMV